MPTLEWIGKDKVVNHHQEVPYRVLDRQYSYDEAGRHTEDSNSENMIIHGDNLEALKALLPLYEGKVKCIYIDPPYNTGNEGWVYNDNVNDPKIKKWLGEVVGKEGEDLSRHDKWLCMMYPRLKLLQRLLSEDGIIFISISDIENSRLRMICDEIFGAQNFVANIIWNNNYSPRNDAKDITYTTDNLIAYSKNPGWQPKRLERTETMDARYTNPDGDPTPWTSSPAHAPGARSHKGMVYAIQHPYTGDFFYPPADRHWSLEQSKILAYMNEWAKYRLENINDVKVRASICGEFDLSSMPDVKAIVLDESVEVSKKKVEERYQQGCWPNFYFTSSGHGGLRVKKYKDNMGGRAITTLWPYEEVGTTTEAKNELKRIFDGTVPFNTPKPSRLLERVIYIASDPDSIILDSFAGSGTTANAVLNMNKADSGNRKFILVEMMDYADSLTAERVKRVIDGYGEGKKAVEGTGGNFSYYELGPVLLLPDGNLNEEVGAQKIREYVYYMETKESLSAKQPEHEPYFMGLCRNTAYYFYYERESVTTLDHAFLSTIQTKAEGYTIYADLCAIPPETLRKHNIAFKKIPRDIARL